MTTPEDQTSGTEIELDGPKATSDQERRVRPWSRFFRVLILSLLLAGVAVAAVFWNRQPSYTATAMLQVSSRPESIVFEMPSTTSPDFDIYKATQQYLLASDFVLIAAMRDPEIRDLHLIQEEPDPVGYLAKALRVDFPGDSELMAVRLTCENPAEAASLVNAVVQAYLDEVVDRERENRRARMRDIDELYTTKAAEARDKRIALKNIAETLGMGDSGAASFRQQFAQEQCAAFRTALMDTYLEKRRLEAKLRVVLAKLGRLDDHEEAANGAPLEADAAIAVHDDPTLDELLNRRAQLEDVIAESFAKAIADRAVDEVTRQHQQQLEEIDEELETRTTAIRQELQREQRRELESQAAELAEQLAVTTELERQLQEDLEESQAKAESFGGSSIDVETLRSEITRLESDIIDPVAKERERLRVELDAPNRIQLIQEARTPVSPDDDHLLLRLLAAGAVAFLIPICVLVLTRVGRACMFGRRSSPTDLGHG